MASYDYPYSEFARDFDAVILPLNAAPHDDMQQMMRVRHHVRAIYSSDVDQVERGAALMQCLSFMQRHATEFDIGTVAVRGDGHSIITEGLLRAVHSLVCSAALELRAPPAPAAVRDLAEQYNQDEKKNART